MSWISYSALSLSVFSITLSALLTQFHVIPLSASDKWVANKNGRVAICFTGDARTFPIDDVHQSILKRVVDPIAKNYVTDVFFSIAIDDETRNSPHKMQDLTTKMQLFNPVYTHVESAGVNDETLRKSKQYHRRYEWLTAPDECGAHVKDKLIRLPHTLYRAYQCLAAISAHERKTGKQYDWVYRLRPDVLMFDGIPTPDSLQADFYYTNQGRTNVTRRMGRYWILKHGIAGDGAIADQMGISSRRVAEVMLRAWRATDDCELYQLDYVPLPEDILRFWALKMSQRYAAIPLNWAIVRSGIGAECKRLYYQHGTSPTGQIVDWKQWTIDCYRYNLQRKHLFPLFRRSEKRLKQTMDRVRPDDHITTV